MRQDALLGALLFSCACGDGAASSRDEPSDPTAEGDGSAYRQVVAILEASCAYQRCHAFPLFGADLDFTAGGDYHRALVGVPACQYDRMALVEPGRPERSWLIVKLTAEARDLEDPYATYIYFDPPPDWDPEKRRCKDRTDDGTPLFGQRMPATAPNMLPSDQLDVIRRWIAEGAPR